MQTENRVHYTIRGNKHLSGTITVGTSKNGAMGVIAAALANDAPTTLRHVSKIEEMFRIIEVLKSIGVETVWEGNDLTIIPPEEYALHTLDRTAAERTRTIIMFIGALIHHTSSFEIPQAGGCRLGSRTVHPHMLALEELGVSIRTTDNSWHVSHSGVHAADIVLAESSDTATINTLIAAARTPGSTVIRYASPNYQVQDVCFYLQACGVRIDGIGTTTLTVHGKRRINTPVTYELSEDPIIAMFYLACAIVTHSSITIKRAPIRFLERELCVLRTMGFHYTIKRRYKARNKQTELVDIETHPSTLRAPADKIHATPYPGLNGDNLPFFAPIATQATGTTLIHDWMYEKRAIYLTELDKLGASTVLADPHRIFIEGPTPLRAAELMAPPALRPAVILIVAMLAAPGTSTLRNVYPIQRGYEDIVGALSSLGADIEEVVETCQT